MKFWFLIFSFILLSLSLFAQTKEKKAALKDIEYELYLTQISAAEALLQLNKIREARKYLEACSPKFRDIEWHFLDKFLDQSETTISNAEPTAYSAVQISPDGKMLAVAGVDSNITLYSYPQLALIKELKGHQGAVSTLGFSNDSKRLASGGRDHTLILWDLESGLPLFKNTNAFSQGIYQLKFSPDDRSIGVVSWERLNTSPPVMGFAKILDAASGVELKKIETEPHPAAGILFTNEGKNLVVSCWGEQVISYDVSSGEKNWIYDLSGPEEYNAFHSIDLSPDGKTIILGSTDHRIHILDSETGNVLKRIEPWEGHTKTVKSIRFTPDGKWFATAGEDQSILVWQADDYTKKYRLIGHTGTVTGLSWSPDGSKLISVSQDGTIKVWNMAQPFEVSYEVCNYGPWQFPLTTDGKYFAAPCSDEKLVMYAVSNGKKVVDFGQHNGLCGEISKDGRFLVTSSFDGKVHLWDIHKEASKKIFTGHPSRVDGISYLNKSGRIVSVGDHTLRVWDTQNTEPFFSKSFEMRPFRVLTSPDESKVYVGFSNGTIKVFSTENWQEILSFSTQSSLNEISISPNGQYMAIIGGGLIDVRNTEDGTQKFLLDGHEKTGYAIDFSPDSQYLISGSYDQTFKLWNLSNGRCSLTFHGYEETIYQARFIERHILVLSSSQGKIFYYDFRKKN